jgi:hypothetical protein
MKYVALFKQHFVPNLCFIHCFKDETFGFLQNMSAVETYSILGR